MSYLCGRQWHQARVIVTYIEDDKFDIRITPKRKAQPITLRVGQSVGLSFKCGYGSGYDRFLFDTTVLSLDPSPNSATGGEMVLAVPEEIDLVQKRSYVRVEVPRLLDVDVQLWQRDYIDEHARVLPEHNWQGRLADISAAGIQIVVDGASHADFRKGQSIGLRFTPLAYETPLMFNAQIRSILPTADGKRICLGLQMVGLEASPEGRLIIQRLCSVVDQYQQLSQTNAEQHKEFI